MLLPEKQKLACWQFLLDDNKAIEVKITNVFQSAFGVFETLDPLGSTTVQ